MGDRPDDLIPGDEFPSTFKQRTEDIQGPVPDWYQGKDAAFVALEQTTAASVEAKALEEENFVLVCFRHALFQPAGRLLPRMCSMRCAKNIQRYR